MKLFNRAKKNKEEQASQSESITKGLLIFADTSTVMHAEQILKEENYDIRVVCTSSANSTTVTAGFSAMFGLNEAGVALRAGT